MNFCAAGGVDKMKIWHAPPTPALGRGFYCWGEYFFLGGESQNFEEKFKIA